MPRIYVHGLPTGVEGYVLQIVNGQPVFAGINSSIILHEDWLTNATGKLNWTIGTSGTATVATGLTVADNTHPGILELRTPTGTASAFLGGAATATAGFILGNGTLIYEWLIRLEDLATAGENYNLLVGLSDTAGATLNNIRFTYLGNGAPTWLAVTTASAISTTTTTSVPVLADTWIKLKTVVNPLATSCDFYIDNVLVANHSTNISLSVMAPRIRLLKTVGTTSRAVYVDYFALNQQLVVPR